jgi:hypothetical protein
MASSEESAVVDSHGEQKLIFGRRTPLRLISEIQYNEFKCAGQYVSAQYSG